MSKVSCLQIHNDRKEISSSCVTKEKSFLTDDRKEKPYPSDQVKRQIKYQCWNVDWRELFTRKKLTVIIFRNFLKLSRWERKMKIWENCNANGKMTKNKYVSYWTRDISSWSLEEKLHWYNITHGVNSSLSIQLWQGVTCPAQRRKGVLRMRVFCTERERAEFKSQK